MENSVKALQKTKTKITYDPAQGSVPKRTESRDLSRHLNAHVSIIHNSRKVEASQVSISG